MAISLSLEPPILQGDGFIRPLPPETWKRSIRGIGGFWQGTLTERGDLGTLSETFYTRIGCHIRERFGGMVTWEGLIYEMDLSHGGVVRRRTLDLLSNRVRASYIDPNNDIQASAWVAQNQSIARYGQKEEILKTDQAPQSAAESYRDRVLAEYAWPWARPLSVSGVGDTELSITACGYAFTTQWRYNTQTAEHDSNQGTLTYGATDFTDDGQDFSTWATAAPGTAAYSIWVTNDDNTLSWAYMGAAGGGNTLINVYTDQGLTSAGWNGAGSGGTPVTYYVRGSASSWVNDIITNDCEFVSTGSIDENLLQVNRIQAFPTRAWDTLADIADMGDTSGAPWRIWVDNDRKMNYKAIDTTPRYYLRNAGLYDSMGGRIQVAPWRIRPGVARDMSFTAGRAELGSWLQDHRDIYLEEVIVDGDGKLTLKSTGFSEADIMGAILLERTKYRGPAKPKEEVD